ncbi:MAG TPA: L-histidine N(alpha)-methyltransferase [Longimicrobiales bacterium]|nr:L-histidine N(alpha)-methyltransferase [Longimicrobiales bacterium]
MQAAGNLAEEFPELVVQPVCADYTRPVRLPPAPAGTRRTVVFFPGSTIGNFEPEEAAPFLTRTAGLIGEDGAVLIGVDRPKDPEVLERAYDDPEGVTRAFNLNLLRRLNRDLGADFDLDGFAHRAVWNPSASRVEMHLESQREQVVTIPREDGTPARFTFAAGEALVTEHSYKYSPSRFDALARSAGLAITRTWTDPDEWFSVFLLEPSGSERPRLGPPGP